MMESACRTAESTFRWKAATAYTVFKPRAFQQDAQKFYMFQCNIHIQMTQVCSAQVRACQAGAGQVYTLQSRTLKDAPLKIRIVQLSIS